VNSGALSPGSRVLPVLFAARDGRKLRGTRFALYSGQEYPFSNVVCVQHVCVGRD
jgi:hypothetical protein